MLSDILSKERSNIINQTTVCLDRNILDDKIKIISYRRLTITAIINL